jgi:hypothetical protein
MKVVVACSSSHRVTYLGQRVVGQTCGRALDSVNKQTRTLKGGCRITQLPTAHTHRVSTQTQTPGRHDVLTQ